MPSTVAEQILAVLSARCAAITTAGGYRNDVTVYENRAALDADADGDQLPAVLLRDQQESHERMTLGGAPRHQCRLQIHAELYTRGSLSSLVADFKKAVFLANQQDMGGLAKALESTGWERVDNLTGVQCETAEYVLVAEYQEIYGDPYTAK